MIKIISFLLMILFIAGCQNIIPEPKQQEELANKNVEQKETLKKEIKETNLKKKPSKSLSKKKVVKKPQKPKIEKLFQTVELKDAILIQQGVDKRHCPVCGMDLVKYYKTNHAAREDGKNIQYCSIHCLTKHINEGAELENPMVVDVTSLKFIPVTEAFYVVGSDVAGTMTKTSKYAFKSLDDAKAFQKAHGGKILDFYSAWQISKKDFY